MNQERVGIDRERPSSAAGERVVSRGVVRAAKRGARWRSAFLLCSSVVSLLLVVAGGCTASSTRVGQRSEALADECPEGNRDESCCTTSPPCKNGLQCGDAGRCVPPPCGNSENWCDSGGCVNLSSDPAHCGVCENRCAAGAICTGGRCECPNGTSNCDGTCANLQSDKQHCGDCKISCAGPRSCLSGTCTCVNGLQDCAGECVDLKTDIRNCRACGTVVDPNSDSQNCGGCGNACWPPNAAVPLGVVSRACVAGQCQCTSGTPCTVWLPAPCSDPRNCFVPTALACMDLMHDSNNCGGCGNVCGAPLTCVSGTCQCPNGKVECPSASGTTCVALGTAANCRACGDNCDSSSECRDGNCVPLSTDECVKGWHPCPGGGCEKNGRLCPKVVQ
jgi:hypothetical protein